MTSLAINLLTYGGNSARRSYAERTLRSTLERIRFSGDLHVHIADDGSPPGHVDSLMALASKFRTVKSVTSSNSERGGYGANYNASTQVIHSYADVVLPLEDDWECMIDLELDQYADAVLTDERIGCVRLGYIGASQELRGKIIFSNYRTFLLFDPTSPEPHVFAGGPRLESVKWERALGPWPTHVPEDPSTPALPGDVEFMVCHRPASRVGVVWPLDLPNWGIFGHVGTIRSTEDE